MICKIPKEQCHHCLKNMNIGNPFFECYKCDTIIHGKCFKASGAEIIDQYHYCSLCKLSVEKIYNPFRHMIDKDDSNLENNLENEPTAVMSRILDNCKQYTIEEFSPTFSDKLTNSFSMMFQNIDGNKSNFDSFSAELNNIPNKLSIIGLAETNIGPDEGAVYTLPGYNSFYQNKFLNKSKGTGVALYIDDSLKATVNNFASMVTANLETLFVTIATKGASVSVGVVYRPPSGSAREACNELSNILESLPKARVNVMGDFNINLHAYRSTDVKYFEEVTLGLGYAPLISTVTHEKPGCKGSCIDNILSNEPASTVGSGTIALGVTHHHSIFQICVGIDIDPAKTEAQTQYFDYCISNIAKFSESLEHTLHVTRPETFSEFFSIYNKELNLACKLDKPKTSKRTIKQNPWITGGIIASIKTKHKLYETWKKAKKVPCILAKNRKDQTCIVMDHCGCNSCCTANSSHKKFATHRKLLKHIIKNAKQKYYGNKLEECYGDSKKTWKVINELRGKSNRGIKASFTINNEKITNRRTIANEFNNYFASIASKLNENYTEATESLIKSKYQDYLSKSCPDSIYMHDCDENEISKIIAELKNGKSSDIPIHVVKHTSSVTKGFLKQYFNDAMSRGIFPDELKVGRITPIYKKDDEELLENYRPVSTLPVFGKILEKLIYARLCSFLAAKGIIYENQFGFRKGHSTSHAVNYSINYVNKHIRKKQHVLGIFIDLSKAFDTLPHDKLLHKLNHYGIRGNALKLLSSYLSSRKQYVNVLEEKSDILAVMFGVPQGSVLGPLLFLLYINDLCNVSNNGKFILFADDTNIFIAANTKELVFEKANEILLNVNKYMTSNLLHINSKKSCYIHFSPHRNEPLRDLDVDPDQLQLTINGAIIRQVTETKFLGVTIDSRLNWRPHIRALNMKLKSACGRIYRVINSLPTRLHKDIYHTLFESHLGYAISVWGGVCKTNVEPLFLTQKKCVRIIFGDTEAFLDKFRTCARVREFGNQDLGIDVFVREPSKPLFTRHNILTIQNLYKLRTLMEVYKILKFRIPISMYSLFSMSLRKEDLLHIPYPDTDFVYRSSILWNIFRQAVGHIDVATSCYGMKSSIKESLLEAQKRHSNCWCELNFSEFASLK